MKDISLKQGLISIGLALAIFWISPLLFSEPVDTYALVSDTLIDGISENGLNNKVVLVKKNVISDIVPVTEIPPNAIRIDLPGTTLMPGMINAHEHPMIYRHDYQNAHLEASSAYKALLGLSNLQNLLLAGWTTIRVIGDADVYYAVQDLKRIIEEGVFWGPRLTGAAHYISVTGGGG